MIPVLLFPQFSPTIVEFGPIALGGYQFGPFGIRWYAMAYILGLVLGWRLMRRLVRLAPAVAEPLQVDDFLTWATVGVVLGGRLGYVLFYQPAFYLANPLKALEVWHGGMSFHGGFLGVAAATVWFCRKYSIPLLGFAGKHPCPVRHPDRGVPDRLRAGADHRRVLPPTGRVSGFPVRRRDDGAAAVGAHGDRRHLARAARQAGCHA